MDLSQHTNLITSNTCHKEREVVVVVVEVAAVRIDNSAIPGDISSSNNNSNSNNSMHHHPLGCTMAIATKWDGTSTAWNHMGMLNLLPCPLRRPISKCSYDSSMNCNNAKSSKCFTSRDSRWPHQPLLLQTSSCITMFLGVVVLGPIRSSHSNNQC